MYPKHVVEIICVVDTTTKPYKKCNLKLISLTWKKDAWKINIRSKLIIQIILDIGYVLKFWCEIFYHIFRCSIHKIFMMWYFNHNWSCILKPWNSDHDTKFFLVVSIHNISSTKLVLLEIISDVYLIGLIAGSQTGVK